MHRRTLFAHIGGAVAVGAGCFHWFGDDQPLTDRMTSENESDDEQPTDDSSATTTTDDDHSCSTDDEDSSTTEGDDDSSTVEDDDPYERHVLSESAEPDLPDGVEPHELRVTNAADEPQEISIRIARDGASVFDQTEAVPANASIEVVLAEPGPYEIEIEADGTRSRTQVDRSWDDCARSQTLVSISSSGIKTRTRSIQSTCD